MLDKNKYFPSYIRYRNTHPTVTINLDLESFQRLKEIVKETGKKKSEIVKEILMDVSDIQDIYTQNKNVLEVKVENLEREHDEAENLRKQVDELTAQNQTLQARFTDIANYVHKNCYNCFQGKEILKYVE